ncbi:uncharacterized protein MELLADRAFT_46585 [Melampsora larici-populina 98AG31]|uniref:Hydroxymethylglutaryl-CoA synthase n=1 Tax=Melampsora larici-populina (strain 98AG31 / pathotype 3-4-7) TaxID=747676 RepID=F4R6W7_MELLP|nr:uncharacterized protein MELLADRAFT_46585 [Melampsora larici-populina 98AG31]EGG11943.1 hypothetical protein MELLADRAFT_46585 [Melampsora larici-populina 98AG31]
MSHSNGNASNGHHANGNGSVPLPSDTLSPTSPDFRQMSNVNEYITSPTSPNHSAGPNLGRWSPHTPSSDNTRPRDVGILAMDVYFPKRCVSQPDLEKFDQVAAGKYTIGLGQERMAYCDDREDINSFLLTVTQSLLQKYDIDPRSIGRIDVGTESIIDKSKSVKTLLMDLFATSGNTDIEGIDSKNACYGGTAALFNVINWVEGSSWDGRYGLVVAGDIAVYADGPARPVGGAGAVAMLIGPNAPLVFEPTHGTHMINSWDFYKPELASEFPEVDGPLTLVAYLSALDNVYDRYREKRCKKLGLKPSSADQDPKAQLQLDYFDYVAFHGPYGKLVQKAAARLLYLDFLSDPDNKKFEGVDKALASMPRSKTYSHKDLEKTFLKLGKEMYDTKVVPTTKCMKQLGNMYTASLYGGLASLLDSVEDASSFVGKKIAMYSYGSGLASSFFEISVKGDVSEIKQKMNLSKRLEEMTVSSCEEWQKALHLREEKHNIKDYTPTGELTNLWPGQTYLESVDKTWRRTYRST